MREGVGLLEIGLARSLLSAVLDSTPPRPEAHARPRTAGEGTAQGNANVNINNSRVALRTQGRAYASGWATLPAVERKSHAYMPTLRVGLWHGVWWTAPCGRVDSRKGCGLLGGRRREF